VAEALALGTALLWAVHPLQTETVEYVTQRTELLVGLFYLAVLYCSLRYWQTDTKRERGCWIAAAVTACFLGMACKEVMVSAPIVVLLFERTFIAGSFKRAARDSWPLYLGLMSSWAWLAALNYDGPRAASAGFHLGVSALVWWLTQAKVLFALYLKLVVWPWPLVIHYEMPYVDTFAAGWPWALSAVLLGVAAIVLLWRRSAIGFAIMWVLLILSPTLVVPILSEVAAERRMYLPLAAIAAVAVVGLYELIVRAVRWRASGDKTGARTERRAVAVTGVAVAATAVTFCLVSVHRLSVFGDVVTLWQDTVANQPDNYRAQNSLGAALLLAGKPADAVPHYQKAIELRSDYSEAESNLGVALMRLGRSEEAGTHFRRALEIDPNYADAHINMGHLLARAGRAPEAIEEYRAAIALKPRVAQIHSNLGHVLATSGRTEEAIEEFRQAIELRPDLAEAHLNLGNALAKLGRNEEAIAQYLETVRIEPNFAEGHNNLGAILLAGGRTADAILHYRRALKAKPDYGQAQGNLGIALLQSGKLDEAILHFEEAVRLSPESTAYANLAMAYGQANRHVEAIANAQKAIELARSQGQTALATQVEGWLADYRKRLRRP
jgi:tetratricopeptide (TPR) repeat protein